MYTDIVPKIPLGDAATAYIHTVPVDREEEDYVNYELVNLVYKLVTQSTIRIGRFILGTFFPILLLIKPTDL